VHLVGYLKTGRLDQNNVNIVASRYSWHTRVAVGATTALQIKTT
jgi:hypothetical protein